MPNALLYSYVPRALFCLPRCNVQHRTYYNHPQQVGWPTEARQQQWIEAGTLPAMHALRPHPACGRKVGATRAAGLVLQRQQQQQQQQPVLREEEGEELLAIKNKDRHRLCLMKPRPPLLLCHRPRSGAKPPLLGAEGARAGSPRPLRDRRPRTRGALALLCARPLLRFAAAVLSKIPGVGRKTAMRRKLLFIVSQLCLEM